jgi:23S rRNA (uracil1939-C5)-methyltransferase
MKQRSTKPRPATVDPLSKGSTLELDITGLDNDGIGWCRQGSLTITVPGAYPGEKVLVKIQHRGRHQASTTLVKVLSPSPDRAKVSPCKQMGQCDGCPLINLAPDAQAAWKTERIRYALNSYQSLKKVPVLPLATPGNKLGYRNSCKLVIGGTFSKPAIGIYKRWTHDIIPLENCPLHHPLLNRIAAATATAIRKNKIPIYHQQTGNGFLRYLAVRVAETTNEVMVVLVTGNRSYNELHHLAAYLQKEVPEIAVVAQNINPSSGNIVFGQTDHFHTKRQHIIEHIGHIKLQLSPRSFFQVNTAGAVNLYQSVADWLALTGKEHLLDIYSGVGGIGIFLAHRAATVTGLEEIEPAVDDAARNARLNRLTNCRFIAGDASRLIAELIEEGERFDRIVVNPPRSGCSPEVLDAICKLAPAKLAYVSCNPDTLVRDLAHLCQQGFVVAAVQPVDMFPQTPHLESVAYLERAK